MTQTIINLGTGGAVLNGQNGSTSGADSNDALYLDWTGLDYVYLPGATSNSLSVPDAAALDITGDIDIRVQVALDDWTSASQQPLVNKAVGAGQFAYLLWVTTTGTLQFFFTEDGSTTLTRTSTASLTVVDGQDLWVRVTLDVDNGASGHDVKFFSSPDGSSWTQLGATVTTAGVVSIFVSTSNLLVGSYVTNNLAAKVYRAQMFNGIDGTKVLDVDTSVITTGAATTFTALTGQTVTINRSTDGRKTVAVVSPVWLFGTDDYMEVTPNALLDFGATESFTMLWVGRIWTTPGSAARALQKGPGPSYSLRNSGTTNAMAAHISDGTNTQATTSSYVFGGLSVIAGVVNRTAQTIVTNINGVASASASTTSVGSLVSASPLRINTVPAAYLDSELLAIAVFRRALTATEISQISAYYQARLS